MIFVKNSLRGWEKATVEYSKIVGTGWVMTRSCKALRSESDRGHLETLLLKMVVDCRIQETKTYQTLTSAMMLLGNFEQSSIHHRPSVLPGHIVI